MLTRQKSKNKNIRQEIYEGYEIYPGAESSPSDIAVDFIHEVINVPSSIHNSILNVTYVYSDSESISTLEDIDLTHRRGSDWTWPEASAAILESQSVSSNVSLSSSKRKKSAFIHGVGLLMLGVAAGLPWCVMTNLVVPYSTYVWPGLSLVSILGGAHHIAGLVAALALFKVKFIAPPAVFAAILVSAICMCLFSILPTLFGVSSANRSVVKCLGCLAAIVSGFSGTVLQSFSLYLASFLDPSCSVFFVLGIGLSGLLAFGTYETIWAPGILSLNAEGVAKMARIMSGIMLVPLILACVAVACLCHQPYLKSRLGRQAEEAFDRHQLKIFANSSAINNHTVVAPLSFPGLFYRLGLLLCCFAVNINLYNCFFPAVAPFQWPMSPKFISLGVGIIAATFFFSTSLPLYFTLPKIKTKYVAIATIVQMVITPLTLLPALKPSSIWKVWILLLWLVISCLQTGTLLAVICRRLLEKLNEGHPRDSRWGSRLLSAVLELSATVGFFLSESFVNLCKS